jgi:SPP1 gp7 family putative phage head morphogenesis protein
MKGDNSASKLVFDEIINLEALLFRYNALEAQKIASKAFDVSLIAKIIQMDATTPASKDRYNKIRETFLDYYNTASAKAHNSTMQSGKDVAGMAAGGVAGALEKGIPVVITAKVPSPQQILTAAETDPMTEQGWLVKDSFIQWGKASGQYIATSVVNGYLMGQTADEIKARLVGQSKNGLLTGEIAKQQKSLERLIRTTLQHIESKARDMTYSENEDLIKGWQYVATLDTRTCPECGALDGNVYDLGVGLKPPIHWNCRCTTVPVVKGWNELGASFNPGKWGDEQRASMDGQVPGTLTWKEWIAKKEAAEPGFAKAALGPAKYAMWKSGAWEPGEFAPNDGAYTADQLKAMLATKGSNAAQEIAKQKAEEEAKAKAEEEAAKAAEAAALKAQAQEAELKAYAKEQLAKAESEAKARLVNEPGVAGAKAFGDTLTEKSAVVGGSTGAKMYVDPSGEKWFVKMYSGNVTQAQNEYIAANIYRTLGIRVPEVRMVEINGQLGIASKNVGTGYVELNSVPLKTAQSSSFIKNGYVADAYLANWDVAGLSMDNIMVKLSANKKLADAVRIDTGGALLYRAQGTPKGSAFGATIKEFDTLLDPSINQNTAKLFSKLTKQEIIKQCNDLLKVPHSEIREIILNSGISKSEAILLDKTLADRRESVLDYKLKLEKELKAERKAAKSIEPVPGVTDSIWNGNPVRYGLPDGAKVYSADEGTKALDAVKQMFDDLPYEQQSALKNYTGSGYHDINASAMRGMTTEPLDKALDGGLPRLDCVVFRGVGDGGAMYDNFDKFVSGEWAGVHFSAYTSTAYQKTGFYGGSRLRLVIDQHGMQSGGLIEGRSSYNGEHEYIIGRNAVFHVKGWAAKEGMKVLYLEEVPPDQIPNSQDKPQQWDYDVLMNYLDERKLKTN